MKEPTPTPRTPNSKSATTDPMPSGRFLQPSLEDLRTELSECKVQQNEAGLNYPAFISNIRGVAMCRLKGIELTTIRTRTSLFVLSPLPVDQLAELLEDLVDMSMKRKVLLKGSKENNTLVHVSYPEYDRIIEKQFEEGELKVLLRSLAPEPDVLVSKRAFQIKLRQATVLVANEGFDLDAFASSIRFVSIFQNEYNSSYYHIKAGTGEPGDIYRLCFPHDASSRITATHLSYGMDHLLLVREN